MYVVLLVLLLIFLLLILLILLRLTLLGRFMGIPLLFLGVLRLSRLFYALSLLRLMPLLRLPLLRTLAVAAVSTAMTFAVTVSSSLSALPFGGRRNFLFFFH